MFVSVFSQGLAVSLGLIVAIGSQNAFVLRQGLRKEHIGSVVIFCIVAEVILITAGVMGMAQALGANPTLAMALTATGVVFLVMYGWQALRRAQSSSQLQADSQGGQVSQKAVLAQAAAFTLLNPHVYLDTILLVGGIGAQHPAPLRWFFVMGATSASALWFGLLGFGARKLAPWFAKPRAWQILDISIGIVMWVLAAILLSHLLKNY